MKVAPQTAAAMAAHWDGRAHRFEGAASHNRHRTAWREVLRAAIGTGPGRAVDLGCGTGACAVLLAGLGYEVTAVDGSAAMIAQARQAAGRDGVTVRFLHADMDRCWLPDGCADLVCLRNVLWTLENPQAALLLAARLLRPGGTVLVADGIWRRNPDPQLAGLGAHLPHGCGIDEDEVGRWLAVAGFGGIATWQDRFAVHPYGSMYDEADTPIPFFVITATKA